MAGRCNGEHDVSATVVTKSAFGRVGVTVVQGGLSNQYRTLPAKTSRINVNSGLSTIKAELLFCLFIFVNGEATTEQNNKDCSVAALV